MDYSFKNILVALDASENAERALVYTGEIVGGRSDFKITLLHVLRYPGRDNFASEAEWKNACVSADQKGVEIIEDGIKMLKGYGFSDDMIKTRVVTARGSSIAGEIMKVQQDGDYGTVVVGRRGVSKAEEFLFGSVSNKVVHYSKGCTVWVIE